MISAGERPGHRLQVAPDGSWSLVGLPGVTGRAGSRREASEEAKAAIAAVLEVPPDSFDVETSPAER
jgi:predicted RNase H-like HicB family nuclease